MARQRFGVFCVAMTMLNVFVCVLVGVSWNLKPATGDGGRVRTPSARFWREQQRSKAFWNKEQQLLDFVHNPVFRSAPPGWLNDAGPPDPCAPDHRVPTQIQDYNTLPQHLRDFLLHMRCRTHPVLIEQPGLCEGGPFLLLAVKSMTSHFDRRQAIRQTWGRAGASANRTVATVFLLGGVGAADHRPDLQGMLGHEAELHGDVLQWDYRDTFYNLTLKDVLFLEWFGRSCADARFVLKGDDDVFINTPRVIAFLEGLTGSRARELFVGDVISDAEPHRDPKLKYFVPESVFEGRYPHYAGGGGFLYSGELALRLRDASRRVALYPIDDVYTGMCLGKLGLVPEGHDGFRTFDIEEKHRSNPCVYRSLMLVHSQTPQEMMRIWSGITSPQLDCQ
ncbi:N-acetyllactosaminide beta-1,3-N-acetylglucosaminyltransferase 2a [Spinachia spinachia]